MDNNTTTNLLTIALTGSIGSGKTAAAEWFAKKGYVVFSADKIAHQLLLQPVVKNQIVTYFGTGILSENEIDRAKLGKLVFSDIEKLNKLNSIIHPFIINEIKRIINRFSTDNPQQKSRQLLIFEIPLLFESGIEGLFDVTVNISSQQITRVKRIMERSQLTREEVEWRMSNQLPDGIKEKKADINIVNDTKIEDLYDKLEIMTKELTFPTDISEI